jgi:hypothetical protein
MTRAEVQRNFPHRCAPERCAICRWADGKRWPSVVIDSKHSAERCGCDWCRKQPVGFVNKARSIE